MITNEASFDRAHPFPNPTADAGPQPLPAGAPTHAAVIEHRGESNRLAIVDLHSRKVRYVGSPDEAPVHPVWSPDGGRLLYQIADTVVLHAIADASDKRIAEGLANQALTPYAFSPGGQWIGVALTSAVLILPSAPSRSGDAEPPRFRMPPQSIIRDLLWSADNRTLLVLLDQAGNAASQLLLLDRTTGQMTTQPSPGVNRLLGWQMESGALVVSRARGSGEEAGTLSKAGEFRPLRDAEPAEEGEFLIGFLPHSNQIVFVLGREDLGDPLRVLLASAGPHHAVPWLKHFPGLDELTLSRDGRWAMFVDKASLGGTAIGGDIYLVSVGAEKVTVVLKAVPGEVSYSSPVPKP